MLKYLIEEVTNMGKYIFLKSAGKQEGTSCVSNMVQLGDFFYLSGHILL